MGKIKSELMTEISKMTKESAYFIGFFWADGWLSRNELKIEIVKEDGDDLIKIFETLGDWFVSSRNRPNRQIQMSFQTTNKELKTFFTSMGKYPNTIESHEKILKYIPEEFKLYFIRGIIDGDGCFYYNKKRETSGHQFSISARFNQDWSYILKYLSSIGVNCKTIVTETEKSKSSKIRCSNVYEIRNLISYIYECDDLIYLKRKKEKAFKILK